MLGAGNLAEPGHKHYRARNGDDKARAALINYIPHENSETFGTGKLGRVVRKGILRFRDYYGQTLYALAFYFVDFSERFVREIRALAAVNVFNDAVDFGLDIRFEVIGERKLAFLVALGDYRFGKLLAALAAL